jgi:hypothetical protein
VPQRLDRARVLSFKLDARHSDLEIIVPISGWTKAGEVTMFPVKGLKVIPACPLFKAKGGDRFRDSLVASCRPQKSGRENAVGGL